MAGTLRVVLIQPVPIQHDPAHRKNPEKAARLLEQASRVEPDLAIFPEYFPFYETNLLVNTIRDLGFYVVAGISYREGGTPYNTATIYSPAGEVVVRQGKRFIGRLERRLWGFQPWEGPLSVVDIGKAKIGVAVCADFWSFPEAALELFLGGANIFINPSYMFSLQDHWINANLTRALDFFTPVVGVDLASFPLKTKRYTFTGGGLSHVIVPPSTSEEYSEWWESGAVDVKQWIKIELPSEEKVAAYDIDVAGVEQFRKDWWIRVRGISLEEWIAEARKYHRVARLVKYQA